MPLPRAIFLEIHQILAAMESGDLEPSLSWAAAHSEDLLPKFSSLQLLSKLQSESKMEVLDYVQRYLAPIADRYKADEFEQLIGCLAFPDQVSQSPYAQFMSQTQRGKLAEELAKQLCKLSGQPYQS